jgi:hypothetical protein
MVRSYHVTPLHPAGSVILRLPMLFRVFSYISQKMEICYAHHKYSLLLHFYELPNFVRLYYPARSFPFPFIISFRFMHLIVDLDIEISRILRILAAEESSVDSCA